MENKLRDSGGIAPNYDGMDDDLFTMKVRHGGYIQVQDGVARYVNGDVDYFDFCTGDFMSMIELQDFTERLGYEEKVFFWYKVEGDGSVGSFEKLDNDMDVFGMISQRAGSREIEMFMEVPPKPIKLDFTYASNKPIELSDDEESDDDIMEQNDFQHESFNFNESDFEFVFESMEPERAAESDVESEAELEAEAEAEAEPVAEVEPEAEAEPETDANPEVEPETKANPEEALHDVEVEVETEAEKRKIREDDAELVDSDYAQSEDDYMPEKRGNVAKGSNVANG